MAGSPRLSDDLFPSDIPSLLKAIPLVDSRHDFKAFTQDVVMFKRDGTIDAVSKFSANIQRKILGLPQEYSLKYTSRCKPVGSYKILGIGPEEEFLSHVVTKTGVVSKKINFDDYTTYHTAIATEINRQLGKAATSVIPIIVDTSRTLSHLSPSIFLICLNYENVADPSNTVKILANKGDETAIEIDGHSRTYEINNMTYTISGTFNEPSINYKIKDKTTTYEFEKDSAHKLTEITICKTNIQDTTYDAVSSVTKTGKSEDTWSKEVNGVSDLTLLYGNYCNDYDKLEYRKITESLFEIAVPYFAKRGGDQLQVESCKKEIKYTNSNGTHTVNNAIFWTIDRVAAAYAILRNVITVLERPNKTAEIYFPTRREAYSVVTIPRTGTKGGAACTRSKVGLNDKCMTDILIRNITKGDPLYDFYLLMDLLFYRIRAITKIPRKPEGANKALTIDNINRKVNEIEEDINVNIGTFNCYEGCYTPNVIIGTVDGKEQLTIVGPVPEGGFEKYCLFNAGKYSVEVTTTETPYVIIKDGGNKPLINDNIRTFVASTYTAWKDVYYAEVTNAAGGKRNTRFKNRRKQFTRKHGGGETFYLDWKNAQENQRFIDQTIFKKFIKLLSHCEGLYFLMEDRADNFYAYDTSKTIRTGGHINIEMCAFFIACLRKYISVKSSGEILFHIMFINFPTLLESSDYSHILIDIYHYIRMWYPYEHENAHNKLDSKITYMFEEILADAKDLVSKARANVEDDAFLHFIIQYFPHGLFTYIHNSIDDHESLAELDALKLLPERSVRQGLGVYNGATGLPKTIHTMANLPRNLNTSSVTGQPVYALTGYGRKNRTKRRKTRGIRKN